MLTAPIWSLTIGSYEISRLHQFEVSSSRRSLVGTAVIRLPIGTVPAPAPGTSVTVRQGYRGSGLWTVLEGHVRRAEPDGNALVVHATDPMALVAAGQVSRSFTSATPQEIIRWVMGQAQATQFQLSTRPYPPRTRFVATGTVAQVLAAVNQAWGIENDSYWLPGIGVWWGPADESPRLQNSPLTFTYGQNILNHTVEANGRRGRLTAEFSPVSHSSYINIRDPRAWVGQRTVRVDRVINRSRPAQVVIEWSSLAEN